MEDAPIRLSGEDVRRVTPVQRRAVLHDFLGGREFTPLQFLTTDQTRFDIYDFPLSEYAILAFDYSYSVERPDALTIWEAQFGDFANNAQTAIDELVCSAEQKWEQCSSLVMLPPHGYEGQGPDHSSARIGCYLQLATQDNVQIVQPFAPASHFHTLRRQVYQRPRRPLIAFTPEQLLRLNAMTSSIEELASGSFRPIVDEMDLSTDPSAMTRVLLCSGRVYYGLLREREARSDHSTAIVRLEQLYPLPEIEIREILDAYPSAQVSRVQNEPRDQGAWSLLTLNMFMEWPKPIRFVSRPESATTATGRTSLHRAQSADLIARVFDR